MGGLIEALYFFGECLIYPAVVFSLRATLMTNLFRFRTSDQSLKDWPKEESLLSQTKKEDKEQEDSKLLKSLDHDFQSSTVIEQLSFYFANLLCRSKYKRMMLKAQSRMTKELDLKKFLTR